MIGRFIIECDPDHFDVAKDAILYLQNNHEHKDVLTTARYVDMEVHMFATRLKRSIRVRQVRP